jgi:predicted GNAT superfamily acetyltransferase
MESYHIHEGKLDDAVMVSANIPEFDDPYEIPEYSKRLNSTTHHILTAYDNHNPIAFKIGYQRHSDGSFYSWMGGVLPNYRRKGIANNLADHQETWAKKNGYISIKMQTREKHKAMLALAINRGFQITNRIEKTSSSNTLIWMNKPL